MIGYKNRDVEGDQEASVIIIIIIIIIIIM
jgi:hypothetical protein